MNDVDSERLILRKRIKICRATSDLAESEGGKLRLHEVRWTYLNRLQSLHILCILLQPGEHHEKRDESGTWVIHSNLMSF